MKPMKKPKNKYKVVLTLFEEFAGTINELRHYDYYTYALSEEKAIEDVLIREHLQLGVVALINGYTRTLEFTKVEKMEEK